MTLELALAFALSLSTSASAALYYGLQLREAMGRPHLCFWRDKPDSNYAAHQRTWVSTSTQRVCFSKPEDDQTWRDVKRGALVGLFWMISFSAALATLLWLN